VGSKGLTLKQHIEQTLGSGTIEQAVKLPRGEDANEWVAVNTVFFYNALNVLYQVLDDTLCTEQRCPTMSAGPQVRRRGGLRAGTRAGRAAHPTAAPPPPPPPPSQYEYLWADGVRVRSPLKLCAPDYTNALFDWVEAQLDDPALFPRGAGAAFPRDFQAVVKTILKRLFRVYAHIYHSHFRQVVALELEPHLNTCFRHFIRFVQARRRGAHALQQLLLCLRDGRARRVRPA
jgi:MOB kinase activator 1